MSQDWMELIAFASWVAAVIAMVIVGWMLVLFCIGIFEKHPVIQYVDTVPADQWPSEGYLATHIEQAPALGFTAEQVYQHYKHNIRALLVINHDRTILMLSGEGDVMKIPAKQTWLYTRMTDGTIMLSADQADEGDQSGIIVKQIFMDCDLPTLVEHHQHWIAQSGKTPEPFVEMESADIYNAMNMERGEAMVARGRARWVDNRQEHWTMTARGALGVCVNFWTQLAEAVRKT